MSRSTKPVRRLLEGLFARLSIRDKLAVIVSVATILALGLGFGLVVWTSLDRFEDDLIRSTDVAAQAAGNYSAIGLAFDDREEAARSLEPLRRNPAIVDAYLYDQEGTLFETWSRSGSLTLPPRVLDAQAELRDGFVHIFRPILHEGSRYGTIYVRASAASLAERRSAYLSTMGLLTAALVTFAVFIAYGLQGLISRPILALAERARTVTELGDYSIRVEKPGNDEIGVLYDGFNDMLDQIQRRQEELERSNRDLDQFAYVASHDLKAPLRAISTLSAWIEEDLEDSISDDGREQLRLLRGRVQRMDSLIEGILQYSRAGRLSTGIEAVDTGRMVAELVHFIDLPEGMEVTVADDMPLLRTRKLRLEQIFQNLISNAIKYHDRPSDGSIEVGCDLVTGGAAVGSQGLWRFWVQDDGPGIAPEHHERVFLMFQTLQPRDRVESTGLGLSLVTKLVEEEGGKTLLDSDIGRGARFGFTWPAERAARHEVESGPADRIAPAARPAAEGPSSVRDRVRAVGAARPASSANDASESDQDDRSRSVAGAA